MCAGPEQLNYKSPASSPRRESESSAKAMNNPIETEHSFSLLELAAENDVDGFTQSVTDSMIDETGLWYSRQRASKRMIPLHRTPLMVAALYGSIEVVKLILSLSKADINRSCDPDKSSALHCAASSGSVEAIDVVKLLLLAGADPNATDSHGHRPYDVIVSPPNQANLKVALKELLRSDGLVCHLDELHASACSSVSSSQSSSSPSENSSLTSLSNSTSFPSTHEKREYPIDRTIPDIRSSIYATDEFRMYSFKVRPCSRSYSHDWTECPFVHPGENARRRDPKKFHYSCVPCPDHRKAPCRRGDLCEYAHGVFESLLHPAQYRTRLCKDGTNCNRRVCFFAHTDEELRPLHLSTGSAVPSPPHSAMSPFPFTPPMSTGNGISQASTAWAPQNVPTLHLPGSHLHMRRLRSSLNTRDFQSDNFQVLQPQHVNDLSCFSANLNELFSSEVFSPSPGYSDQLMASPIFSPSRKSAVFNQVHRQESMFSPVKASMFSPKHFEHSLLQPSFPSIEPLSPSSSKLSAFANCENRQQQLRRFSSWNLGSNISHDVRYNLCRDLGSTDFDSSPTNYWSQWESDIGKVDWSVQSEELGRLRKSFSTGHNEMEPDTLQVESPVQELPSEMGEMANILASGVTLTVDCSDPKQIETLD